MSKIIQLSDSDGEVYPLPIYREYTITRTENDYFDSTSVARIKLRRWGQIGQLFINLKPSTSIPANTALFEIGSYDCTFVADAHVNVPGQTNASCSLLYSISNSGVIQVGNYSSTASGTGFYRAVIPVLFTSTSD